jgi:hypothetical protein
LLLLPAPADNAAMREAFHMLCGPVAFVFGLLALRSWFILVLNSFRAAANRRLGLSRHLMMYGVLLGGDIFTEKGEKLADRARSGCLGFILFWSLGFLTGMIWSATG